jgi:hypothetical protein
MLFRQDFLEGIREGRITLAFRRWRRPSVRAGGTLMLPIGQLQIGEVRPIAEKEITEHEATRAGYASRKALLEALNARADGTLYRIALGALGPDPRVALRASAALGDDEVDALIQRLDRLDAHAAHAWTRRALELIRDRPAVRAGDLCKAIGMERLPFKANVRKLKALGLTESLEVGYRLSPRGEALVRRMAKR